MPISLFYKKLFGLGSLFLPSLGSTYYGLWILINAFDNPFNVFYYIFVDFELGGLFIFSLFVAHLTAMFVLFRYLHKKQLIRKLEFFTVFVVSFAVSLTFLIVVQKTAS